MTMESGEANELKAELLHTTEKANRIQIIMVAMACFAIVFTSIFSIVIGVGNRELNLRMKDCTEPTGKCYQQAQQATAKAVQAILDYIQDSITPHRLRNEAENVCQVDLFAGAAPLATKLSVLEAEAWYDKCVFEKSGGLEPPAVPPPNPLTTTTTRGHS